ncbi:MAG: InlB B-repeat-containing protein [Dehalococcoidia bacterium]
MSRRWLEAGRCHPDRCCARLPSPMVIVRNDTRLRAPFRITLSMLLFLALVTVAAVPLAVEGEDSTDRADLTITMTGETQQLEFELSISSGEGGAVEVPGEGFFTYGAGTVVDLEAVADDDFQFAGWIGDVDSISDVHHARTTITVDGDYSITATFEEEPLSPPPPPPPVHHVLVVTSTAGGNVTAPGEGTFAYDEGTEVELVTEPITGHLFVEWTGDVSTIADVRSGVTSIIMDGDYHIVATFDSVALPDRPAFPWWWVIVGIVIAGLLAYFLWWRRRGRPADGEPKDDPAVRKA